MRYSFLFAVFTVNICGVALLRAEDSLFSEIAMESVFEKPIPTSPSVASISDGATLDRITGVSSLMLALKAAGFESKQVDHRATIQIDHAGWKLPVTLEVDIEQDRILCEMSLIEIKDISTVDNKTLLGLLASGDVAGGAFFAYDAKTKLIELRSSFQNRAITAKQLKADLVHLASIAEKHADVWSTLKAKPATKADVKTASSPVGSAAAKPNAPSFSLVGTWGATISSGESFAIQFAADSAFKLVTVKSGKTSTSKGKATRSGNTLTLVGDDKVTLNCSVTQTSADKFQLAINDAKGTPKVKLDFKKAN